MARHGNKITTKIVRHPAKFGHWREEVRFNFFSSLGRTVYGVVSPIDHKTIIHVALTRRDARKAVFIGPRKRYWVIRGEIVTS